MDLRVVAIVLELSGEIMIAITAIMVHRRVWREHKIDIRVYKAMKREQVMGVIGIASLIIGKSIELFLLS